MSLVFRIGRSEWWVGVETWRWPFYMHGGRERDEERRPWGLGAWVEVF